MAQANPPISVDAGLAPSESIFSGARAARLLALPLVAGLILLALDGLRPPDAARAGAPTKEFSSERAKAHIKAIAENPRPIGSPAHARARDYILAQLTQLGLSPQVQRTTALNQSRSPALQAARVENIVAEISGSESRRAALFVSHYDSVPNSPGASDDGVGVAATLEMARALVATGRPKNTIILLFTDGEEIGLMGARAFVEERAPAENIAAVINLEARGNAGPAIMFETGADSRWLIGEFARFAPKLVATSFSYEVYRLLPNDTDFSVFKKAGFAGLNFAQIEGPLHYHNRLDGVEEIDERSLQHQGATALALARRLGDMDLRAAGKGDAVYFDVAGRYLVRYPRIAAIPLAVLSALLFAAVLAAEVRRKRFQFRTLFFGFGGVLVCVLVSAGCAALGWQVVRLLHKEYRDFPQGEIYNAGFYLAGFIGLTAAAALALYKRLRRGNPAAGILAGVLLAFALLAVVTSVLSPGASYLFTWPLLFGSAALYLLPSRTEGDRAPVRGLLALTFSAVPALLLFVPLGYLILVAVPPAWAGAACALIALPLAMLVPHLDALGAPGHRRLPWLLAGMSVAAILAGGFTAGYDRNHPKPDNIFYALNADSGEAVWASTDPAPDQWTAQMLGAPQRGSLIGYTPFSYPGFLKNRAPALPLDAPSVTVVGQDQIGQGQIGEGQNKEGQTEKGRTLRLRVKSTRQAPMIIIQGDAKSGWSGLTVNDKKVDRRLGGRWVINYYAADGEELLITVATRSSEPVTISATDVSYELPKGKDIMIGPRAQTTMAAGPYADATLVTRTFSF
jgi:hypothetical protein